MLKILHFGFSLFTSGNSERKWIAFVLQFFVIKSFNMLRLDKNYVFIPDVSASPPTTLRNNVFPVRLHLVNDDSTFDNSSQCCRLSVFG